MLRNYTETLNGRLVSGTSRVGVLGSVILGTPSGGDFGPGIFNGYGPLTPSAYYRAIVLSSSGTPFVLNEDGSGEASGAFSASLRLLEDNTEFATGVPLDGGYGSEAVVVVVEGGADLVSIAANPAPARTAIVAFIEGGDDRAAVLAAVQRVLSASVAAREVGDDVAAIQATKRLTHEALLVSVDAGDDTASVQATVRRTTAALVQGLESAADDTVHVLAVVAMAVPASMAFAERGDDLAVVLCEVASSVSRSGTLASLAAEYVAQRSASGLFIGQETVLSCAIMATRFYAGWATLEDVSSRVGVFAITGNTEVTPDEWAIIGPLFRLYCDREHAVVVESSATMGMQPVGKSSSEVASEISQAETELPQKAFVEPAWSVGLPPVS